MSNIKFKFTKGDNEVEVDLEDVSSHYVNLILAQSFFLINEGVEIKKVEVEKQEEIHKLYKSTEEAFSKFFKSIKNTEDELHEHNIKNKKDLNLKTDIKSHSNESDVEDDVPDFYKTGIKIRNGVETYKCHYRCSCGDSGNHYVPIYTLKVNCYNCGQALKVVDADDGFPNRDEFGNYYIATQSIPN